MVGHDDKMVERISFAMIKKKSIDNYLPDVFALQYTFAITLVEPFVNLFADDMVVFFLYCFVPRFRMRPQPFFFEVG